MSTAETANERHFAAELIARGLLPQNFSALPKEQKIGLLQGVIAAMYEQSRQANEKWAADMQATVKILDFVRPLHEVHPDWSLRTVLEELRRRHPESFTETGGIQLLTGEVVYLPDVINLNATFRRAK